MKPALVLRLATVVWCQISSLAVILTGDVPLWLALVVLTLTPILGLASPHASWLAPARSVSSILAIAYLLFFPLDWLVLSERLIFAVVHLMFYLKLHTLLHLRGEKDRNRLYFLCLFEMLAAASMTVSLAFLIPLLLFVVTGVFVLILDQVVVRTPSATAGRDPGLVAAAFRSSLGLGLGLLAVSGLTFVLLPRTSYGGFRLGGVEGVTETGLSEDVRLGDFGEIKRSRDVVMRILSGPSAPSPPRWRGAAFDRYENGEWKRTNREMSLLPRNEQLFLLARPSAEPFAESEVFLEPLDTDVLFLPPASLRVSAPLQYLFIDSYLTLRTGRSARAGRRYRVEWRAAATARSSAVAGVERIESERRREYLQVPPFSKDFYDLAPRLVPPSGPLLERAAHLETALRERYRYSLETPRRRRSDPLEDFLFESGAGHCEYFATAMVMMLRSQGIPSRLVTGFLHGERNEIGGFELVRKEDAHAWVEVFDPERGWIAFDPTPPAPPEAAAGETPFLSKGIDSLRLFWEVYVIAFDAERQRGILGSFGLVVGRLFAEAGRALRGAKPFAPWLSLGGAALVILFVASRARVVRRWRLRLRLRWPFPAPGGHGRRESAAVRFYERALAGLERSGFPKPPGATPAEYASALEAQLPGLSELTGLYYRVRFGDGILEPEELTRAERLATAVQLAALGMAEPERRAGLPSMEV